MGYDEEDLKTAKGNLVQIIMQPSDEEGHHYEVAYHILKAVGDKIMWAMDYERERRKGPGNGGKG